MKFSLAGLVGSFGTKFKEGFPGVASGFAIEGADTGTGFIKGGVVTTSQGIVETIFGGVVGAG